MGARSRVGVRGPGAGIKTGAGGRLGGSRRPFGMSFVFVHTRREVAGRREQTARGGGASARQRTGARGEGRGRGASGGVGAGPSLPSIVCDWLACGAGAGRCVLGDNLGVSHLSIVFAAAAAPPSLSNACAASSSPSSSRRRRGVSFPVCPLPRNRAPLAVSPGPGPGGAGGPPQPLRSGPQTFWPRNGGEKRVSLSPQAAAAPQSLAASAQQQQPPRRRACSPSSLRPGLLFLR